MGKLSNERLAAIKSLIRAKQVNLIEPSKAIPDLVEEIERLRSYLRFVWLDSSDLKQAKTIAKDSLTG